MRSKLFVGFLAIVTGFLVVTNPVVADAAMTRCDVKANPTYRPTPTDPGAGFEGWLTCDPAILPDTFNNTVCLQAKTDSSFVDIYCCKGSEYHGRLDSLLDVRGRDDAPPRDLPVQDPCPCVPTVDRQG